MLQNLDMDMMSFAEMLDHIVAWVTLQWASDCADRSAKGVANGNCLQMALCRIGWPRDAREMGGNELELMGGKELELMGGNELELS